MESGGDRGEEAHVELRRAFAEPAVASINRVSGAGLLTSIDEDVIPALRARHASLRAAIDRYRDREGVAPASAEHRLDVEVEGCDLLQVVAMKLADHVELLGAEDVDLLATAAEELLAGRAGAPGIIGVKALARVRARGGDITPAAAKLVWGVVDAQQVQEHQLAVLAAEFAQGVEQGQADRPELVQRIEREGELYRELAARGVRLIEFGAGVTVDHERIGLEALRTATATGEFGSALLVLDTICEEATGGSGAAG